jgi:hypothetical protein
VIIGRIEGIKKTPVRRTKVFISKDDAEHKNAPVMKVVFPNWLVYWFQKAPKTRPQAGKYPFMLLI